MILIDKLFQEYVINKKSTSEIAKEVGLSNTTIKRLLHKFNIPIATKNERYAKAIRTRLETTKKRGFYHSKETRKTIGEKNKTSLLGNKLSKESIQKRTVTRQKHGWHKNKEEYLKKISGSNSWHWLSGEREYDEKFNKTLKLRIKQRDVFCQICHSSNASHIHHIDYDKKNSSEDNLLLLCNSCHSKTNFNRRRWMDILSCFMSWKINEYGYNDVWNFVNNTIVEND